MLLEEKRIHVIVVSGKKSDWDCWLEKFIAKDEFKRYQKLLLDKKNKVGYDKVPTTSKITAIKVKIELNIASSKMTKTIWKIGSVI